MDTRERKDRGLKGSWEWLEYAAQLPAKAVNFTTSADTLIYGGRCIYMGFTMANNAVGGGNFNLYNGRDANGAPLNLDFPSNGSTINRAAAGQDGNGKPARVGVPDSPRSQVVDAARRVGRGG